jgi:hypothetical protein
MLLLVGAVPEGGAPAAQGKLREVTPPRIGDAQIRWPLSGKAPA